MSDSTLSRLGQALFVLVALLFVAGAGWPLFASRSLTPDWTSDWGMSGMASALLFAASMFVFPVVGLLVVSRLPRNAIGWILLSIGLVWGTTIFTDSVIKYAFGTTPGSGERAFMALTSSLWVPGIGLAATYLVLLFPDGHVPSPRWRPLGWACAIAMVASSLAMVVGSPNFADVGRADISNPLYVESLGVLQLALALFVGCILGSAWGLIHRFRRSHGVQRLQLKWFAAAASASAACYAVAMAATAPWSRSGDFPPWVQVIQQVSLCSFVLLPLATGIAILRYRLYDIDVVINRTIVYASLLVVLGSVYALGIYVVGGILRTLTGSQDDQLAVAASTLAVAAAFRPALARIRSVIDRRFYRRRYDAMQVLEAFNARLRDQVSLDALSADLVGAVTSSMQPAHVSLWLKETGQPG